MTHPPAQSLPVDHDPFAATAAEPHLGRPLQSAFREVVRHIGLQTPLILVTGGASTGKTLLAGMIERLCVEMGLTVRHIDRGDQLDALPAERPDVLVVDEAGSLRSRVLEALLAVGRQRPTTVVLIALPSFAAQLKGSTKPAVIALNPLPLGEARRYLLDRAASVGLPHLFSEEALDLIVQESQGSPRLLRSIASLAYNLAASQGASEIGIKQAVTALASQDPADLPPRRARVATEDIPKVAPIFEAETAPHSEPALARQVETEVEPAAVMQDVLAEETESAFAVTAASMPAEDIAAEPMRASEEAQPLRAKPQALAEGFMRPARPRSSSMAQLSKRSSDMLRQAMQRFQGLSANVRIGRGAAVAAGCLLVATVALAALLPGMLSAPSAPGRQAPTLEASRAEPVRVPQPLSPAEDARTTGKGALPTIAPASAPAANPTPTAIEPAARPVRSGRRAVAPRRPPTDLSPEEQAAVSRGLRAISGYR